MSQLPDFVLRIATCVVSGSVGALLTWQLVGRRLAELRQELRELKAATPDAANMRWDDVAQLSPEIQTAWLRIHVKSWPTFFEEIRMSHEQLESHRISGFAGPPQKSMTLHVYRQARAV
jgi:hypothetical protein